MSWTRGCLAALAVRAPLGLVAGCGGGDARERTTRVSASPVGTLLDDTDEKGRHYREIDEKGAPKVGVEVQPDADGGWDVRLTVRDFRFSPAGAKPVAVAGRGTAVLSLDGRTLARLRTTEYHLPGRLVRGGTHQLTARLYADGQTVWAVDGEPVESVANITASGPEPTPTARGSGPEAVGSMVSRSGSKARAEGRTCRGRSSRISRISHISHIGGEAS